MPPKAPSITSVIGNGSLLAAVAAADEYKDELDANGGSPPSSWATLHLSLRNTPGVPLGYISEDLLDFLLYQWPEYSLGPNAFVKGTTKGDRVMVAFAAWVLNGGRATITDVMARLAKYMKDHGMYRECLAGWRNERYAIFADRDDPFFQSTAYTDDPSPGKWQNHAFDLERSACAIFGTATFGVHMTAYEGFGDEMKIWVPRRSLNKPTWPGKLDNSVGGGIPAGMSPYESLVKECQEEASLPEKFVREYVRCVGATSYFAVNETGQLQPELEYVYDLQMQPGEVLKPFDDEVQNFELWPATKLLKALRNDPTQFKPNSGLIIVDFLMRHGFVTPENEPNFAEITARCKRDLSKIIALPICSL